MSRSFNSKLINKIIWSTKIKYIKRNKSSKLNAESSSQK